MELVVSPPCISIRRWDTSFFRAESGTWYFSPWCWALRASLSPFGIHANSVPAAPGEVEGIDPIVPALLHVGLGVLCWVIATSVMKQRVRVVGVEKVRRENSVETRGRTSRWRALAVAMLWHWWTFFSVLMLLGLCQARWRYGSETASALYSLLCIPVGSTLAGTMAWNAQCEALRGLLIRPGRQKLFGALLSVVEETFGTRLQCRTAVLRREPPSYLVERKSTCSRQPE